MGKLTDNAIDEICIRYSQGYSMVCIGREFKISTATVKKWLNRRGIQGRSTGYRHPVHSPKAPRKYSVNEHIFDVLDSPEKAYWLGFLMADGTVHSEKSQLRLRLAIKDKDHVIKFRGFMESTHPIKYDPVTKVTPGKSYPQCGLSIYSKYLCQRLEQYGITRGRSFNATLNAKIPEFLISHYWRGLVDGDGRCATIHDGRVARPLIELTGSKLTVDAFSEFAQRLVNSGARTRRNNSIWKVVYSGASAITLMKVLYDAKIVALDRKLKVAKVWIDRSSSQFDLRSLGWEEYKRELSTHQ